MASTLDEAVQTLRELIHQREQAIIEADVAWNPYDELFTDKIVEAIEYVCDTIDNEF